MLKTYSICLTGLAGQKIIVIGGGEVAQRKVEALLEAGGKPWVISPKINPELQELVRAGVVQYIPRVYQTGDLAGAFLVIAATDQPEVNQAAWEEACQKGCLVNVVDDPAHSNFIVPAVLRRGPLSIAISTGGGSPALARRLREKLEADFAEEYGILAEILHELRPEMQKRLPPSERMERALRVIDSDILIMIRDKGRAMAAQYARKLMELPE